MLNRFSGVFLSLLFLSATGYLPASPLLAQERGLLPTDYYGMSFLGDVALSPSGERVAFTVTTVLEEENDRRRSIWLQDLRDGQPLGDPVQVTDPTRNASVIGWSPNGRVLAFNSRRGDESIWFLDTSGPGEAYRIPGVRAAPIWSPNGDWIAFVTSPEETGRSEQRQGSVAPDAISITLDPERFDGRVITHLGYKRDGTHPLLPHPATIPKRQIFVVPAEGGEPIQITDLPFHAGGVTWSPDSRHILFSGDEHEDDELNNEPTTQIYAVAREGGEARRLSPENGSHRAPNVAPDGRRLAFLHTAERNAPTHVMVVTTSSDLTFEGPPRNLTPEWDLSPGSPEWTADGEALRWEASAFGNRHLWEVRADGGAVRQVTQGDRQLGSISASADGTVLAYTSTDPVSPGEVFVSDGEGGSERRITSFNDEWLREVALQSAERITWQVIDGTEIEGWVIPPVGMSPDRQYPLVLKAHGGPAGMYGNTFFETFHILSAAGFYVFYPNPRGSSGYGHDFMLGPTVGHWGLVDEEDFLTGIDSVLVRFPAIDPQRIGVAGGSYGGYVTNWLTARSDRFAAAVTSRSISSLETLYLTTDAQGWDFGGPLWENRDQYRAASPISHVDNVTAPTLIIHSEYDHRTPMQDAEMWFTALKKLEVPVEFVRYPRSSHGLSRSGEPWLLVDRLERIRSWFVHWLIDVPALAADGVDGSASTTHSPF